MAVVYLRQNTMAEDVFKLRSVQKQLETEALVVMVLLLTEESAIDEWRGE